jgi:hypothetical protein
MKRGPEYLSSQLEPVVDAVGCEGEWVTAHEIGFVEKFEREGYSSIVHGLMFDSFLKCRNAKDLVKHKRFGGLLSPRYELKSYDLASAANHGLTFPFVEPGLREQVIRQRRSWMLQFFDQSQYSHVDVLATFPHLRRVHANWCAERRFLPIRMPALDKRVIEFFHRCPVLPRLGGRLLEKAAYDLLGPCKQIPNANTGVRIGSGRFSALTQRSFRLIKERSAEVLKVGVGNPKIEHSWHDYPRYWRTSAALKEIRQRFEHHLENLYPDFLVFPPRAILDDKRLHWSSGFRLLQVAAWMDRVPRYAEILVRITRSEDRAI